MGRSSVISTRPSLNRCEERFMTSPSSRRVSRPPVRFGMIDGEAVAFIPVYGDVWAIVSEEDAIKVDKIYWYLDSEGYVIGHDGPRGLKIHRVILGLKRGERGPDHRNGNKLDNRRSNLRRATAVQQARNVARRSTSSSPFKGVYFHLDSGKWRTSICVRGKRIFLGVFCKAEEAAQTYDAAARKYYGEFARTNF